MAEVSLQNVNKIFDKNNAVINNLNLEINNGEFLVLVGPSGCGKSTTLRMIAGLEDVSAGNIYIGGDDVTHVHPKDRDISMVFQNYALYPHMTVYENLAFGLKLRKYQKKEIQERVEEASTILGIHDLLKRKPKQLSGGQRQRVALGRAIVRKPRVFLFDEPLSNLDAKLRVQMRTEIKKLHKTLGTTMIYVTHDQVEAMTMGDRIVVMKDGNIHQADTPLNVYNKPNDTFVAGFIGSPPMNFFDVQFQKDKLNFLEADYSIKLLPEQKTIFEKFLDKPITIGIRPENISHIALNSSAIQIPVQHQLKELLGSETVIFSQFGNQQVVSKVSSSEQKIDSLDQLWLDLSRVHFFDEDSNNCLK